MLDGGGDDLFAFRLRLQRGNERSGIRLGATGSEDDLGVVFRAEQFLHLHARLLDGKADLVAKAVHRDRIPSARATPHAPKTASNVQLKTSIAVDNRSAKSFFIGFLVG